MLKIGLTGGIGSGKTTIANLFAQLGVPILDADIAARAVIAPGMPALQEIARHFGPEVLNTDGTLNRAKMREIIFNHPREKIWLEKLLHPLIRVYLQEQVNALDSPYCILVIPLLLENKRAIPVDRVLVIDAPIDVRLKRIQQRDQVSLEEAKRMVKTQLTRKQRLAAADDIINNNSNTLSATLLEQVNALHQFYLSLAAQ